MIANPGPDQDKPTRNTVDYVIEQYDRLAETVRIEADARREVWDTDPIASAYDRLALRLEKLGRILHEDLDLVTPEVFAELNRVTPVTVRRWCHNGQLAYLEDARGLLIRRHSPLPRTRGD